jgi:hypothetical protein
MDEEDGRLGPGARQSGTADVQMDALAESLCHLYQTTSLAPRTSGHLRFMRTSSRTQVRINQEKLNENVPGK